jgi:cytochrome P450 enzyme
MERASDAAVSPGSALPMQSLYFAPHSDEFHRNPYPTYKLLQLLAPAMYWSEGKAWLMTRYADVAAIQRDNRFSLRFHHWKEYQHTPHEQLIWKGYEAFDLHALSDADNQRLANAVEAHLQQGSNGFPRAVIAAICDQELVRIGQADEFDLITDYAESVSVRALAKLFALPDKYLSHFINFTHAYLDLIDPSPAYSHEEMYRLMIKISIGRDLINDTLQERRAHGDGSFFIDRLICAQYSDNHLNDEELISLIALFIAEGLDSSRLLIANTVYQLLSHPTTYAMLQANPALWSNAVREVLRYDFFSKLSAPRYALEDCRCGDAIIAQGERVYPIVAAAHRDPAVFARPDEFDITRNTDLVIDRGLGTHPFIGLNFAALEAEVAVRKLFEALPSLALAGPPTYDPDHRTLRAMTSLRLSVRPVMQ